MGSPLVSRFFLVLFCLVLNALFRTNNRFISKEKYLLSGIARIARRLELKLLYSSVLEYRVFTVSIGIKSEYLQLSVLVEYWQICIYVCGVEQWQSRARYAARYGQLRSRAINNFTKRNLSYLSKFYILSRNWSDSFFINGFIMIGDGWDFAVAKMLLVEPSL